VKKQTLKLAGMTKAQINLKVAQFRRKLEAQIQEARVILGNKDIGAAIEAVYTRYGDVAINMPALAALVCRDLGATQDSYKALAETVYTFIRNADWLMVTRGKNGGVRSLRAGVKVGTFGATCNSRIICDTHSRTIKRKSRR
jgi:hypothetical protein